MLRLTKTERDEKAACGARLAEARDNLTDAVERWNAALREAKEMAAGIAEKQDAYFDERSEGWQEGDNGQAYEAWKSAWEELDADEMEMTEVDEFVDAFDNAPDAPEG